MPRERGVDPLRSNGRQPEPGLSIAELRQLITLMQRSDIEEIIVERDIADLKLTLRKAAPSVTEAGAPVERAVAGGEYAGGEAEPQAEPYKYVTAPFVGRFHLGAKPGANPLVNPGDLVRVGQIVGMIETLNVMTEVEATLDGRVVEVKAAEGQAVEYGQPLLALEPQPA
jgi:acetyl-CoA carboxylase biotin carboxyl carrier protein